MLTQSDFPEITFASQSFLPADQIDHPFEFQVLRISNFNVNRLAPHFDKSDIDNSRIGLFIEASLYYGSEPVSTEPVSSMTAKIKDSSAFWSNQWLRFENLIKSIPLVRKKIHF